MSTSKNSWMKKAMIPAVLVASMGLMGVAPAMAAEAVSTT